MMKAKCQLYITSEDYVEKLRAQLVICMKTKHEGQMFLMDGMLMLLKEHQVPRKASFFAEGGAVRCVGGVDEIKVTDVEVVQSWPMPKEFFKEEKL